MKWNRNVAIVGVGRTRATSKRNDVNQYEMVNEAVTEALQHAGLSIKDIDFNLIGDMELFQGDYSSDLWQVDGFGGRLKPGYRMTTGGCTGAMLCFIGHALMENRAGLIVQGDLTQADGHAERRAAMDMIHRHSPALVRMRNWVSTMPIPPPCM